MADSLWKQIKEIVEAGQSPIVTLHPSQEIKFKLAPGRPKNPPEKQQFKHYLGSDKTGKRPRCRTIGCSQYLRLNQRAFCCDDCEEKAMSMIVPLLEGLPLKKIEELVRTIVDSEVRLFERIPRRIGVKALANPAWKLAIDS